jgi:hypothetical protein
MFSRVYHLLFLVVTVAASVTACTSGSAVPSVGGSAGGGSTSGGAAAGAGGGGAAGGMKQPILGLIDMQTITWHDTNPPAVPVPGGVGEPSFNINNVNQFPGVFGGIVINATWDIMQPTPSSTPNTAQIDTALAAIATYNSQNTTHPISVKLRIYAGSNAPLWAKQLDGGPINIQRNPGGCQSGNCPLTIGLFWATDYKNAWQQFQAAVAAKYDSVAIIKQVAVTSCTTQTDEPFVQTADQTSKANIQAAVDTWATANGQGKVSIDTLYQSCLMNALQDYSAWKNTLIDYTFNTFTSMAIPSGGTNPGFTTTVMSNCGSTLGARCVLDNHALMEPISSADVPVYSTMQSLAPQGIPVNFQTQAPTGMGCQWTATIARGVKIGASAIEVWPDTQFKGFDSLSIPQVTSLAQIFINPIAVPAVPNPLPTSCSGFNPTS